MRIDDNRTLDIRKISEKELKTYLPEILKSLFAEYAEYEKQQEWLKQWDGVIDKLDKPNK